MHPETLTVAREHARYMLKELTPPGLAEWSAPYYDKDWHLFELLDRRRQSGKIALSASQLEALRLLATLSLYRKDKAGEFRDFPEDGAVDWPKVLHRAINSFSECLTPQDRAALFAPQNSETMRQRRQEAAQEMSGVKRAILEAWDDHILPQFPNGANYHQVLRVLNRLRDPSQKEWMSKTVQNAIGELRKADLLG